jgi:DMSO/TMAO reductase YedYZ heme-binding membrane subunit
VLATLTWYVTRASGVIAYVALGASVLVGLSMSTRVTGGKPSLPWLLDVHRMLSGVGVALVAIHVVSIVSDTFVGFSPVDVLVPFATSWRPLGVAAGIVAMYLLVAVEASSLMRSKLKKRTWRAIHFSSFGLFLLASVHFLAAGTDSGDTLSLLLLVGMVGAVLALTTYRIVLAQRPRPVAAAPSPRVPRPQAPSAPVAARSPRVPRPRAPVAVSNRTGVAPPPRATRVQHTGGHPDPRRQPDRSDGGRHDRDHRDLRGGVRIRPTP